MSGITVDSLWHNRHDWFNLIALPIIVLTNSLYLLSAPGDEHYFWLQFWTFMIYLVVDLLWIISIPKSVAAPVIIIAHHIACIYGWSLPLYRSDLRKWCACAASVEVNTFFLILRRVLTRQSVVVDCLFCFSWIILRLILYPYLAFAYWNQYADEMIAMSSHTIVTCFVLLLFLIYLNTKWTVDLANKTIFLRDSKRDLKDGLEV